MQGASWLALDSNCWFKVGWFSIPKVYILVLRGKLVYKVSTLVHFEALWRCKYSYEFILIPFLGISTISDSMSFVSGFFQQPLKGVIPFMEGKKRDFGFLNPKKKEGCFLSKLLQNSTS